MALHRAHADANPQICGQDNHSQPQNHQNTAQTLLSGDGCVEQIEQRDQNKDYA